MDLSTPGRIMPVQGMEMYSEVRGEGEPLLLLHGFTGCSANWDLIFPEPPAGYRLILPDLRGHGRSTNPSRQFTFRQSGAGCPDDPDRPRIGSSSPFQFWNGAQKLSGCGILLSLGRDALRRSDVRIVQRGPLYVAVPVEEGSALTEKTVERVRREIRERSTPSEASSSSFA